MTRERITVLYRCGWVLDQTRPLTGPACGNPATHVCHYGQHTFTACDEHPCHVHREDHP